MLLFRRQFFTLLAPASAKFVPRLFARFVPSLSRYAILHIKRNNWIKRAFNGILNAILVGGEDFDSVYSLQR
jgi:hypothetical protein